MALVLALSSDRSPRRRWHSAGRDWRSRPARRRCIARRAAAHPRRRSRARARRTLLRRCVPRCPAPELWPAVPRRRRPAPRHPPRGRSGRFTALKPSRSSATTANLRPARVRRSHLEPTRSAKPRRLATRVRGIGQRGVAQAARSTSSRRCEEWEDGHAGAEHGRNRARTGPARGRGRRGWGQGRRLRRVPQPEPPRPPSLPRPPPGVPPARKTRSHRRRAGQRAGRRQRPPQGHVPRSGTPPTSVAPDPDGDRPAGRNHRGRGGLRTPTRSLPAQSRPRTSAGCRRASPCSCRSPRPSSRSRRRGSPCPGTRPS